MLEPNGRPVRRFHRVRLERDLVPAEAQDVKLRFSSPLGAGSYLLRLHLVQPVRGTLDDCVAPIEVPFDVTGAPPARLTVAADGRPR